MTADGRVGRRVASVAALSPREFTTREAAADPTRREALERLLAIMPEGGVNPLGYRLRPARLLASPDPGCHPSGRPHSADWT